MLCKSDKPSILLVGVGVGVGVGGLVGVGLVGLVELVGVVVFAFTSCAQLVELSCLQQSKIHVAYVT